MTSLSSASANSMRQYLPSLLAEKAALAKVLQSRAARTSLLAFTEFTNPQYQRAGHHQRIAEKLEAVERGEIDRLMIFMPPRHGKSELASKRFPAWCLGRKPTRQIIAASYNSDLASDFGRNVRNIVAEPEFGQVFPGVSLAPDSQAANRMNTNHGGAYVAAGVGTAVTGRGAHIALIDDPFKDREEADSERRRELVWDWYRSTLFTRLMPGGAVVLIQTRWHEDDLAGRLLEADAAQWEVLDLPAIDRDGNALWPEWYPVSALQRIRDTVGPREWSALYQQQPQPDEGTYFRREWFKPWDIKDRPPLRYYGTSDYAVTDGGGDYTVHRVWGIDSEGQVYRIDGWRGQTAADQWIERKIDLIAKHKPLAWFGEGGVIQKAVEPMLKRRMIERKTFCRMEWLPSVSDKPTRARSFQAMAASGRVFFEPGADIDEFLVFPAGKHDDDVDTASLIGRAIDQAHPAIVSGAEAKKPLDMWATPDSSGSDWKVA
jgi:predicted phage terminase large subunit-like protein